MPAISFSAKAIAEQSAELQEQAGEVLPEYIIPNGVTDENLEAAADLWLIENREFWEIYDRAVREIIAEAINLARQENRTR